MLKLFSHRDVPSHSHLGFECSIHTSRSIFKLRDQLSPIQDLFSCAECIPNIVKKSSYSLSEYECECNTANCVLYSYLALANTTVEQPVEIVQYVLAIINNAPPLPQSSLSRVRNTISGTVSRPGPHVTLRPIGTVHKAAI
jgi:hypothetical protein